MVKRKNYISKLVCEQTGWHNHILRPPTEVFFSDSYHPMLFLCHCEFSHYYHSLNRSHVSEVSTYRHGGESVWSCDWFCGFSEEERHEGHMSPGPHSAVMIRIDCTLIIFRTLNNCPLGLNTSLTASLLWEKRPVYRDERTWLASAEVCPKSTCLIYSSSTVYSSCSSHFSIQCFSEAWVNHTFQGLGT